jgi:hypothetical protein
MFNLPEIVGWLGVAFSGGLGVGLCVVFIRRLLTVV